MNMNIPNMSIYISAYQVCRNVYQHYKYVDINMNIPIMSTRTLNKCQNTN